MDTQKIVLFVVMSFALLVLWDEWQKEHAPHPPVAPVKQTTTQSAKADGTVPVATSAATQKASSPSAGLVTSGGQRIQVTTDALVADIDTLGGDIRTLRFVAHRDAEDKKKGFQLFDDRPEDLYVPQSGLLGGDLPTHKVPYSTEKTHYSLSQGEEALKVVLHWQGANGVTVEKTLIFHRGSYLIDVDYTIHNGSATSLQPNVYYQLLRHGRPPKDDPAMVQTFTGGAFYTELEKFRKVTFSDVDDGKVELPKSAADGWVALLQHYFLSAWLPEGSGKREFYARKVGSNLYAVGVVVADPVGAIRPGETGTVKARLYAGPQEQAALSKIAPGLDLTVDYGWLTIIASPLYWVLYAIQKVVHNWGVAIILLTVLIKLVFFPLSAKSYRSMAHMRKVTPKLQKIKELYGDDRQRMHQAMMELYKTEKINPFGGCLPILVQIPVFIALYWVILYSVEIRQAPFYGWITDLSTADPYYILPLIMGVTMLIQTKLNPTPPDPVQAKVMMAMPFAMTVFFVFFPSGLVLYWVVNNILSIGQQWYITRSIERDAKA